MDVGAHVTALPSWQSPERIVADWDAANRLPAGEREAAIDIILVKHGAAISALLRDQAISAAPNVIRLADARTKLPGRP